MASVAPFSALNFTAYEMLKEFFNPRMQVIQVFEKTEKQKRKKRLTLPHMYLFFLKK